MANRGTPNASPRTPAHSDTQQSDPITKTQNISSSVTVYPDDSWYEEMFKPTTKRWSEGPRTEIPGFHMHIPPVPPDLTPDEEWHYVFTTIRSISNRR